MSNKSYPYFVSAVDADAISVTLSEAKAYLKVLDSDTSMDTLITQLIRDSESWFHSSTDYKLFESNFQWLLDYLPITLPIKPIVEITKIEYLNDSDTYLELVLNTDYRVIKTSETAVTIHYITKPTLQLTPDAVRVTFKAGYKLTNPIPNTIKRAILYRVSESFDNRGDGADELNRISETLIEPFMPVNAS